MSGKTQFRSPQGCCICGTKSSSSRFTPSKRFSQHFEGCFGLQARGRNGDLCNACVLCIKRWLKQPYVRRERHHFAPVVDSKRGTGPKHMKQITKQRKRREARLQHAASSASLPASVAPTLASQNGTGGTLSSGCCGHIAPGVGTAGWCCSCSSSSSSSCWSSSSGWHNSHHLNKHLNTVSIPTAASVLVSDAMTGGVNEHHYFHHSNGNGGATSSQPPASSTRSAMAAAAHQHQLQHPPQLPSNGLLSESKQAAMPSVNEGDHHCRHDFREDFRAPDPPLQSPPKQRMNRYRRQSQLMPVKLPSSEQEIDQLLREIMAQNSEAINFDCREMHMAFQNRIRLRSRTVATSSSLPSSGCSSSTGSGSLTQVASNYVGSTSTGGPAPHPWEVGVVTGSPVAITSGNHHHNHHHFHHTSGLLASSSSSHLHNGTQHLL